MVPEVVQVLQFEVFALGMLTPNLFITLLGLLPRDQMVVIKVVVHDSGTAIPVCKGALFTRESLITDAIGTLRCMHEERESIGAGQRVDFCFEWLRFDGQAGFGSLLDAVALDRLSLVAESYPYDASQSR